MIRAAVPGDRAIRVAVPGDEPAIEAFLAGHAASSMFLRSNLRDAGLVDRGAPLEATYAIAREGERIVGVASLAWNGMILLQAPDALEELVRAVIAAVPSRAVTGMSGPLDQVERGRAIARIDHAHLGVEDLYALELAELRMPAAPSTERTCRRSREDDLDPLADWRFDYLIETFGCVPTDALRARARDDVRRAHASRSAFVLEQDGEIVSACTWNARIDDLVQIGGVWTPPALRSRGLARTVVAGALAFARDEGLARAILFTGRTNHPARRAYEALGFRIVGEYGLAVVP